MLSVLTSPVAGTDVPALRLEGIAKSFGPVVALKGMTLDVRAGEVHAVVGENGAGKSTLIAIAAGVLAADRGRVLCAGAEVAAPTPAAMRARGVAVAYQHPALAPDLTVLENLLLVAPDLVGAAGRARAEALIARVALPALRPKLHRRVGELALAERHVVEIARALAIDPTVLFLDEPTEPFQQGDVQRLFAMIRELTAQGTAIVYVSHRLHEVGQIADRMSVMRDGELVDTRLHREFTASEIVTLIAGRPLAQIFPTKSRHSGPVVLQAEAVSGAGFRDVDLAVHAGEIVGLAGVEGQGQREFLRALAGVNRRDSGRLSVGGVAVATRDGASRRAGIGFVPDDRHAEGVFLGLSIRENLGLGALARILRHGITDGRRERDLSQAAVARFAVKAASINSDVADLSGGNQQKVLFAREVLAGPRVLLIDEPTKGVDIGARSEIYGQLRELAQGGVAVVVASSDGVELEGLCDRVAIFARGRIVRELTGADVTDTVITEANLTATGLRAAPGTSSRSGGRLRGALGSDQFPAAVLALMTLLILVATNVFSPYFLQGYNIATMLTSLAILAFISAGQLCTILVGGIDLAVGPLAGLAVVLASFVLGEDVSAGGMVAGAALVVLLPALYGLLQGLMVVGLRLPPVVVTLASFIGLQGISLVLRPQPAGSITDALSDTLARPVLHMPAAMLAALAAVAVLEYVLYRRGTGLRLRAVGSDSAASLRLGVRGGRVVVGAFVASGALTGIGGLLLAAKIGIGSASTGVDYTLMSITAVVLGGASVAGGRGSFLSTLLGAAMVQVTISASAFLQAGSAWQYWLVGMATLLAAGTFSLLRPRPAGH